MIEKVLNRQILNNSLKKQSLLSYNNYLFRIGTRWSTEFENV